MRIEIEIPKEFEEHFKQGKFKDSFKRIMADIEHFQHSSKNGYWLCAGRYELETIEMLGKAFENSKQAYPVEKVVKELEEIKRFVCKGRRCCECEYSSECFEGEQWEKVAIDKAIEIVKEGCGVDG